MVSSASFSVYAIDNAGNSDIPDHVATWRYYIQPITTSTTPADGATGVSVTSPGISATFNVAMDPSSIYLGFTLRDSNNNPVPGGGGYDGRYAFFTFTPFQPLAYSTTYTATIDASVTEIDGYPVVSPYSWTFTTEAAPTPP
jgi:Bacterial Ig-like domain